MKYKIEGFSHTPTGVAVEIQGFGVWGLSESDVRVLSDGDHLIEGTWPEHEDWCDEDWKSYADSRVAELLDEHQNVERFDAMREATMDYPGFPQQVWGGWVWYVEGREYFKRRTYEELIETTYTVVEQIGIDEAFDLSEVQS